MVYGYGRMIYETSDGFFGYEGEWSDGNNSFRLIFKFKMIIKYIFNK